MSDVSDPSIAPRVQKWTPDLHAEAVVSNLLRDHRIKDYRLLTDGHEFVTCRCTPTVPRTEEEHRQHQARIIVEKYQAAQAGDPNNPVTEAEWDAWAKARRQA